jgi:serine/threonine protein kinase
MAELEGRTLDRYELRRIIGRGGMANVYEGYDPNFRRVVAVKVFKREDDDMLRRFIREAHVMAGLHHPHLVQVYDSGECLLDGVMRYYIVMPLLSGGTLRTRIRRSPLSLPEICQSLKDIAGALDYIHHEGIIHRDIKSSNVLLDDEGRCYLTDFGIARVTTDVTQLTSTGNVLGTVDYVAPELFEVHRRADARSDLYSLGVLLYEMVTGRLPFSADNQLALISMHVNKQAPSPRLYVPQLSSQVEYVVKRGLEKQPEKRYGDATALAEAFCQAVKQKNSGAEFAQTEREPAAIAMGPLVSADATTVSTLNSPAAHPSPLANKTEGFVRPPVPVASALTETQPPMALPRQRESRRPGSQRVLFLTILALVALIIVSIPIGYTILNHAGTPSSTPGVQPTQSAAQATASHAAATVNAQASATAGPIGTATAGQPAYQDALTDANNPATAAATWNQGSQCAFASDGYHITQPASFPYFKGCREQSNTYGNLALSVNVNLFSGHSAGVFFRLTTNFVGNYDGYLFEIDNQGNYKISREQGTSIIPLKDWAASTALHTGYHVSNLLQLTARGNTFLFYANGKYLGRVQNDYNSQPGAIGFLATVDQQGSDAEVVYSNLKVYSF